MKSLDTLGMVMLLGAIHGFFLAFALFAIRRGNRAGNRILAFLLLLFSASILLHTLAHAKYAFESPHFATIQPLLLRFFEPLAVFYIVAFAFGPLIYLYVSTQTIEQFSLTRKALSHFLPSLFCFFIYMPFFFQAPVEQPGHFSTKHDGLGAILSWVIIIHVAIYILRAIRLVQGHQRSCKDALSSIERTKLKWLRLLIISFLITWIVALLTEVYSSRTEVWNYPWVLVSILIYTIGYISLRQPEILTGAVDQKILFRRPDGKKYEKSTLTEAKAEEYLKRLQDAMAKGQLHLRNDLSLHSVAKELSISHHHLSQVINQRLKKNFYEFVNCHRIEEAKKRLTDSTYAHLSLAEIAYQVGFNSLASFNSAFKKFTQMTPSQFRREAAL